MNTTNSFSDSMSRLIRQTNLALEIMSKVNESIVTDKNNVNMEFPIYDEITSEEITKVVTMPSYNSVIKKINTISRNIDSLIQGKGSLELNDGTHRSIQLTPIASVPDVIQGIQVPETFSTRSNWFFESMMSPQLTVSFDLKEKIDDKSDRILVKRVIFDNYNDQETEWFKDNIVSTERSYYDLITLLNTNNKKYWEDQEIQDISLSVNSYYGKFLIKDKVSNDGDTWFVLDNIRYGINNDKPSSKDQRLNVGSFLKYGDTVWKITDISESDRKVKLTPHIGLSNPIIGNYFEIYSEPFSEKNVDVAIGYNECNCIFFKGINKNYSLLGSDWSNAISFYTNDLMHSESNISFVDFYNRYVSDFGKRLIAQAKEKFIPTDLGIKPNPPDLKNSGLAVTQINTQLDAALDTNVIKSIHREITSTKSAIGSLKNTISRQKSKLVEIDNPSERGDLNNKISSNIEDLAKRTIEYESLVQSLNTLADENSAVLVSPKYRIRGFFPEPELQGDPVQEIVQYEYAYRYLRIDNTGNELATFNITDTKTGQQAKGVYTDWIYVKTRPKHKIYNPELDVYEWVNESINDGEAEKSNQVDIPIQKGEKVEIKIRSISEAGYPDNPVTSEWSDAKIIEFPNSLVTENPTKRILGAAVSEEENIKIDRTLSSLGIPMHIADSMPNPNVGTGTYFKHQSINLAHDLKKRNKDGVISNVKTINLQEQLDNIAPNTYITLSRPTGTSSNHLTVTGTMQQLFQAMINVNPDIYNNFVSLITS